LRPATDQWADFFQLWASARNALNGLPIYEDQQSTAERYLGSRPGPDQRVLIERSSQTPTAVLLAVPFAGLSYPDATLAWNLLSLASLAATLWLVARELRLRPPLWSVFPLLTLLLVCHPFRQQTSHGQLNLVLLALVTAGWAFDRSDRSFGAGAFLGAATAIKLFPGLFFLYFVLRGRWKAAAAFAAAFAGTVALTVAVLGWKPYWIHVEEGLPHVWQFRDWWVNASLAGLWNKLFDPGPGFAFHQVEPLWRSPAAAQAATYLSWCVVLLLWARVVWRARARVECDRAFGLTATAMLLLSPITWDHYLLLLLLPLTFLWLALPPSTVARGLFLLIVACLWIAPLPLAEALIPEVGDTLYRVARPAQTLTLLSFQCYAVVGLFAFTLAQARGPRRLPREDWHSECSPVTCDPKP
jgi:alpha-1,2-mannosyltransferase